MRPPVLPSGNLGRTIVEFRRLHDASMRPPVLPSGNFTRHILQCWQISASHEAAGFTQRKRAGASAGRPADSRFNEAAGFTQRKRRCVQRDHQRGRRASMRPPVLPSGNAVDLAYRLSKIDEASMRPPVLPSGNHRARRSCRARTHRFNEAAGFTQRKLRTAGKSTLKGE